jgi:hypothetical protein
MKKYIWLFALTVVIGLLVNSYGHRPVFGQVPDATTVTFKGEVVDLHCFVTRHGGEGKGASHAGCANACLARNVTAGFVASDGKVYVLFDHREWLLDDRKQPCFSLKGPWASSQSTRTLTASPTSIMMPK